MKKARRKLRARLSKKDKRNLREIKLEWEKSGPKSFNFLMIGRTGVGKSSTINSLLGEEGAKVGHYEAETNKVRCYEGKIKGIKYGVFDSPGLGDTDQTKRDRRYLTRISKKVDEIDCLLYVTQVNERRVRSDEIKSIKLITKMFTKKIWRRAVIVFTHADTLSRKEYSKYLNKRAQLIRREIAKGVGKKLARRLQAVAVANNHKTNMPEPLPDGKSWLGELYTRVFCTISDKGVTPFYLATGSRLKKSKKNSSNSDSRNSSNNDSSSYSNHETNVYKTNITLAPRQEVKIEQRVKKVPLLTKVFNTVRKWGGIIIDIWRNL